MLVKLLETASIAFEGQMLLQVHNVEPLDFLGPDREIVSTSHKGKLVNLDEYIQGKGDVSS